MLVVDDEHDTRHLARLNLELDGHEVHLAEDGAQALEHVVAGRPDLLLLDVMMPVVDGWGVLEAVKAHADPAVSGIPVLMLTADDTPHARARSGIGGAIRYLLKPLSTDDLRAEVHAALDGEPELDKRRRVQRATLAGLARAERGGDQGPDDAPRPRITRLERRTPTPAADPRIGAACGRLPQLTGHQRHLLVAVLAAPTVTGAAAGLGVSRSTVYARLRRVSRCLGTASVAELLALLRSRALDVDATA